jgi:hypothetical protein
MTPQGRLSGFAGNFCCHVSSMNNAIVLAAWIAN